MRAPRTQLECKDRRAYLMLVGPGDCDPELLERKGDVIAGLRRLERWLGAEQTISTRFGDARRRADANR